MLRCELHDPLGNQCEATAVLTVQVLVGLEHDPAAESNRAACVDHVWEAVARSAREVVELRGAGAVDPRIGATIDALGDELLELLRLEHATVGDRWPLARPWSRR